MARTLRRLAWIAGFAPVPALWALPLTVSLIASVSVFASTQAWRDLLAHPQLWPSISLSLWTGTASLAGSLLCALLIAATAYRSRLWPRLALLSGSFLAIPHLAFAVGFSLLIAPSGFLARLFFTEPPSWTTTQDPLGLSLIATLILKETPFILWLIWSLLVRTNEARLLADQWRSAASLGHGSLSIWLRVLLPQLLPKLAWPLLAVWVYGATVVDMALVIGPTQPPTFALIIWSDLNDSAAEVNARGAAGAILLTAILAGIAAAASAAWRLGLPSLRRIVVKGPSLLAVPRRAGVGLIAFFILTYVAVLGLLVFVSAAGHWPFPQLLPEVVSLAAWRQLLLSSAPVFTSLALAAATSLTAVALAILWLEGMSASADRVISGAAALAIGLPVLLVASGQYRMLLATGLTGSAIGLFLVHLAFSFAYVFLVLRDPYRSFDPRLRAVAYGLNTGALRFWFKVKAPLLKAPLTTAAAIGFAVAIAQYVPAQLAAAGRYSTLPMETVTLSSGGNRALLAAFALALTLPPALAFLAAAIAARPPWR